MILSGSLVEFIDGGRFICGLAVGVANKKVRLISQNGRELHLPESRIVNVSQQTYSADDPKETIIALLKERCTRRATLAATIDLRPLWEVVSEEKTKEFPPDFLAEMHFGSTVDDDQRAAFLRAVFTDALFFKYKNGQVIAHTPEQVEQLQQQRLR
ncbi:MAG: ribonuclease R, partial [Desulfobulbus sp.]|nr:ribonuclease R [Desulfobulbus sp.]